MPCADVLNSFWVAGLARVSYAGINKSHRKPLWKIDMRTSTMIALSSAVAMVLFSVSRAESPQTSRTPAQPQVEAAEREQPGQPEASHDPEPTRPADDAAQGEGPQAKKVQDKRPSRREPVKVVDISPELATHEEIESLKVEFKRLSSLRLRQDGSLLGCDADAKVIRVIGPEGEQVDTIEVEFSPEAMDIGPDGTIYCGGEGRLAKLDAAGRVLKTATVPAEVAPTSEENRAAAGSDRESDEKEPPGNAGSSPAGEQSGERTESKPAPRRRKKVLPKRISGIAVSGGDVFVAFGSGWSTGSKSKLYRFDAELQNPRLLAEGLRGCCQRCDIVARDGVLYLAENSAHRVVLYDRQGNVLRKWGERGRNDLKTFGACCNPMNICSDRSGLMYTAESGLGRVKRYTSDGEFVDLVGYVGTNRFWHGSGLAASCSNMAIAATPGGERVYVMDHRNKRIRVLQKKRSSSKGDKDTSAE
jgi:hypothetical protein